MKCKEGDGIKDSLSPVLLVDGYEMTFGGTQSPPLR